MEFEELKKMWADQDQSHQYKLNETAILNMVKRRSRRTGRVVGMLEIMLIIIHLGMAVFLFSVVRMHDKGNIFLYSLGGSMLFMGVFILIRSIIRVIKSSSFDDTVTGNLNRAIFTADYQVRLSSLMIPYLLIVGVLLFLGAYHNDTSPSLLTAIIVLYGTSFFAARWEHKKWHVARKTKLERLKEQLQGFEMEDNN